MADRDALFESVLDILGASAMSVDTVRSEFERRGLSVGSLDAHGIDDLGRVLQLHESLAHLLDGRVAYVPAILDEVSWTVPISHDDADRGFIIAEPHLTALFGWMMNGGVTAVDDNGTALGTVLTDGFDVDGVDTDVVIWPEGSLDAHAGGLAAVTLVDEATVRLSTCATDPIPSDAQINGVRTAFERCATTQPISGLLSDEPVDVVTASSHDVAVDMVLGDPDVFRTDPLAPLPDLIAAADLEAHGHQLVGPVGTDWDLLDHEFRVRRTELEYGLTRDQANTFILLTGAATTRNDAGALVLGTTDEEITHALTLIATMLDDAAVAEAAWDRWSDLHETGDLLQDLVDELVGLFGDEPLPGVSWLRARQLTMFDRTDEAITVLERVRATGHGGVLADLAAIEADRSSPLTARRLLDQAGVDPDVDLDGPFDPSTAQNGFGVELAEEIAPFVALRPKPMAGRNERCPCGSGRKYKHCHLGNELHAIEHRASWLYVKMMRYIGLVAPDLPGAIADDILDEVYDPDLRRMVIQSYLPTDLTLHEAGLAERFIAAKRSLLPADELALAKSWETTTRSVYEVVRSTYDSLDVVDLATRDRLTVRESVPEEQLDAGWRMIGRLLPIGDSFRAYSGFIPVNDDMVDPLLQAFATRQVETVAITIGSIFEAAEAHDEMAAMFDDNLDLTELQDLLTELGDQRDD